jgi:ribosomal protein S18 acetylase RimI-like enzyme
VRNRPALRLFEQAGFKRYRKLPGYYGPGIHGVRLRLVVRNTQERRHVRAATRDR